MPYLVWRDEKGHEHSVYVSKSRAEKAAKNVASKYGSSKVMSDSTVRYSESITTYKHTKSKSGSRTISKSTVTKPVEQKDTTIPSVKQKPTKAEVAVATPSTTRVENIVTGYGTMPTISAGAQVLIKGAIEEDLARLTKAISKQEKKVKSYTGKLSTSEKEIAQQLGEIYAAQGDIERAQSIQERKTKIIEKKYSPEISELNKKYEELQKEQEELRKTAQDIRNRRSRSKSKSSVSQLNKDIESYNQQIADYSKKVKEYNIAQTQLQSKLESAQSYLKLSASEIEQKHKQYLTKTKKFQKQVSKYGELATETQSAVGGYNIMAQAINELAKKKSKIKTTNLFDKQLIADERIKSAGIPLHETITPPLDGKKYFIEEFKLGVEKPKGEFMPAKQTWTQKVFGTKLGRDIETAGYTFTKGFTAGVTTDIEAPMLTTPSAPGYISESLGRIAGLGTTALISAGVLTQPIGYGVGKGAQVISKVIPSTAVRIVSKLSKPISKVSNVAYKLWAGSKLAGAVGKLRKDDLSGAMKDVSNILFWRGAMEGISTGIMKAYDYPAIQQALTPSKSEFISTQKNIKEFRNEIRPSIEQIKNQLTGKEKKLINTLLSDKTLSDISRISPDKSLGVIRNVRGGYGYFVQVGNNALSITKEPVTAGLFSKPTEYIRVVLSNMKPKGITQNVYLFTDKGKLIHQVSQTLPYGLLTTSKKIVGERELTEVFAGREDFPFGRVMQKQAKFKEMKSLLSTEKYEMPFTAVSIQEYGAKTLVTPKVVSFKDLTTGKEMIDIIPAKLTIGKGRIDFTKHFTDLASDLKITREVSPLARTTATQIEKMMTYGIFQPITPPSTSEKFAKFMRDMMASKKAMGRGIITSELIPTKTITTPAIMPSDVSTKQANLLASLFETKPEIKTMKLTFPIISKISISEESERGIVEQIAEREKEAKVKVELKPIFKRKEFTFIPSEELYRPTREIIRVTPKVTPKIEQIQKAEISGMLSVATKPIIKMEEARKLIVPQKPKMTQIPSQKQMPKLRESQISELKERQIPLLQMREMSKMLEKRISPFPRISFIKPHTSGGFFFTIKSRKVQMVRPQQSIRIKTRAKFKPFADLLTLNIQDVRLNIPRGKQMSYLVSKHPTARQIPLWKPFFKLTARMLPTKGQLMTIGKSKKKKRKLFKSMK